MTFVNKYMLFSALVITCAASFVSAAEQEAKSWQAPQMRAILAQRQSREKKKRSTDFRNKSFNPENQLSSWRVPSEVGQNLTILGMLREVVLAAALREQEEALRREEAILRARIGGKERCCFL